MPSWKRHNRPPLNKVLMLQLKLFGPGRQGTSSTQQAAACSGAQPLPSVRGRKENVPSWYSSVSVKHEGLLIAQNSIPGDAQQAAGRPDLPRNPEGRATSGSRAVHSPCAAAPGVLLLLKEVLQAQEGTVPSPSTCKHGTGLATAASRPPAAPNAAMLCGSSWRSGTDGLQKASQQSSAEKCFLAAFMWFKALKVGSSINRDGGEGGWKPTRKGILVACF